MQIQFLLLSNNNNKKWSIYGLDSKLQIILNLRGSIMIHVTLYEDN